MARNGRLTARAAPRRLVRAAADAAAKRPNDKPPRTGAPLAAAVDKVALGPPGRPPLAGPREKRTAAVVRRKTHAEKAAPPKAEVRRALFTQ